MKSIANEEIMESTPPTYLVLTFDGIRAPVCYGHISDVPRSHVNYVVFVREDRVRIPGADGKRQKHSTLNNSPGSAS